MSFIDQSKQFAHNGTRWQFLFAKQAKRKGQCRVRHCKRLARVWIKPNLSVSQRSVCDTCACRLYRANNPDKEAYRQIRDRALRRGQIFNLSFEDFLEVIEGTEYLARRGRGVDELHLDREKVELGYVKGNLRVITCAENLRKQREVDYAQEPF